MLPDDDDVGDGPCLLPGRRDERRKPLPPPPGLAEIAEIAVGEGLGSERLSEGVEEPRLPPAPAMLMLPWLCGLEEKTAVVGALEEEERVAALSSSSRI